MTTLTPAQREILSLLARPLSESDLAELRALIIEFLAKKTVAEADKAFDERGYADSDLQTWKKEHTRLKPTAAQGHA